MTNNATALAAELARLEAGCYEARCCGNGEWSGDPDDPPQCCNRPDAVWIGTPSDAALLAYGRGLLQRLEAAEAQWAAEIANMMADSFDPLSCTGYDQQEAETELENDSAPLCYKLRTLRAEADELLAAIREAR